MDLQALSAEFGFAACYVFPTESFGHYRRRLQDGALHSAGMDLITDPQASAPWANAILALIYPYRPYADEIPVSGNYPSSNAAYHASNKLMQELHAEGMRIERAYVPIRELLTRSGIGTPLKNGLTFIPQFGTRYAVQTLIACLPEPVFTPTQPPAPVRCAICHACERICPSGAIGDDGYDFQACARAYMGGDSMEDWVMDAMTCMLGCELCQKICPYNAGIKPIEEMPDAFRLEEILSGHIKPVLQIVGTNLNKKGRIIQHACVIAAKQGRDDLIPLIEPWASDVREGVRVAAAYALKKLRT
ncbi:MAG: 4Fe-4S double cluster binding domain-containing protein [Eubacteriales bacterium]|nr:4Fe-4S double cluster binding domain-containing protein [Eubacteriales bacterium]